MAKNSAASLLTSVDELFTTQDERDEAKSERIVRLPLDEISDFPNHPFKVRMDDCMMEMVESVKAHGVLVPAIVRPNADGGYEMIAGHRRKLASSLAGQMEMDCIVRNLTDDEAIIIMVDSNLQRDQILPSEKAFAYKMKLDAMKRQGQRTDLTSSPLATKLDTAALVGKPSGDSRDQVFRFIRLTYLIPELLEMVDNSVLKDKEIKQIALRPAVELSYLSENEQRLVLDTIDLEDCTPSHAQAIQMRAASERGELTEETILSLMQQEKPNQKEQFRMRNPDHIAVKYYKENLITSARNALKAFKEKGKDALITAVNAMKIPSALEMLRNGFQRVSEATHRDAGKLDAVREELHGVGLHLKNAGRALIGKPTKESEQLEADKGVLARLRNFLQRSGDRFADMGRGAEELATGMRESHEQRQSVKAGLNQLKAEQKKAKAPKVQEPVR